MIFPGCNDGTARVTSLYCLSTSHCRKHLP